MTWQPIETAPKEIAVWAYGLIPGEYGYAPDEYDMVKAVKGRDGRWTFAQAMPRYAPIYWKPSHWMPLPAPPEQRP